MNPIQSQQVFAQTLSKELEKVTMSWNSEIEQWYPIAMKALNFSSCIVLNIPQKRYTDLFEREAHGLKANIVAVLCNNIEQVSPHQMGYTPQAWLEVLILNQKIGDMWEALIAPFRDKVLREMKIMNGKAVPQGIKIIKGEA